ncbi:hypothetical protein BLA29_015044, partial [Euroglyphus maynei]
MVIAQKPQLRYPNRLLAPYQPVAAYVPQLPAVRPAFAYSAAPLLAPRPLAPVPAVAYAAP